MSMDLPDLLEPERIRCRCDIHSKKRALQTVAELLGESLRQAATPDAAASDSDASEAAAGGSGAGTGETPGAPASTPPGAGASADTDDEPPTRVANLEIGTKRERGSRKGGTKAARAAAEADADAGEISDMEILDALIVRERLGSTGIGHGIALPHSRLGVVDTPLAAMITLNEGVDFESVDGEPVDIVLGLLVPQDCNDEHLKILANLARRFNDGELRDALREQDSGEDLFAHLQRLASRP